ncbi:MAG: MFS transporter [Oscillospiraceae bacterium]|nr:MFS transporter [Oscillospiraceae bacterium]
MKLDYRSTMLCCFTGYIVQAVVNNFVPLLFITFHKDLGIPLGKITLLVTFNFAVQLIVDMLSAKTADKVGYRASIVFAHFSSAAGLISLAVLPRLIDPFSGILISVMIYAIGGGIIEVLISPIMESCPTDNKEKAMSLLHSFYCWGHVGVVIISTLFFSVFGIECWRLLAALWAIIPIVNGIFFLKAPIAPLISSGEKGMGVRQLFKNKTFLVLMLMMVCAGASEQAVSQWASAFAEQGLGISKAAGDIAGPMTFAVLMGTSRAIYGKYGDRLDLEKMMTASSLLCVGAYLLTALTGLPAVSLIGCAVCGFSVGIMWPGTFSRATVSLPTGGTAMFAFLALAGDLGCSGGPTLAGFVSDACGGELRAGILAAVVFPLVMTICLIAGRKKAV